MARMSAEVGFFIPLYSYESTIQAAGMFVILKGVHLPEMTFQFNLPHEQHSSNLKLLLAQVWQPISIFKDDIFVWKNMVELFRLLIMRMLYSSPDLSLMLEIS